MKRACLRVAETLLSLAGTLAVLLVHTSLTDAECFLFFVRDVLASLAGREALAALVFALLASLYWRFARRPYPWRRLDRLKLFLLAAFFALTSTLGAVYRTDDGVLSGFLSPFHLLLMAGKMVGFFSLFYIGMKAILFSLPAMAQKAALREEEGGKAVRRSFWLTALCLACAWAPSFLAHFPGAVTADGGRVLQQYFGEIMATADHPVAYTFLAGSLVRLGALLGGNLAGILCYTLVQWLLMLGVMAWSVSELKREGFPPLFRYAVTAVYALHPALMQTGTAIIKDIPYVTAFVAYMLLTVRAFLHPQASWRSRSWWAGYTVFSLLTLLLRHNGVLAVAPMAAVLAVRFHRSRRQGGRARYGLLAAPVAVLFVFNSLLVPAVAIPVETSPDVLGVAIQQTARILKNEPGSVSAGDLAVIDRVLEADRLASAYAPHQSDSVRKLYRYFNGHTPSDVFAFSVVAARLSLSHPLTAAHAFFSLSGGFLDAFDTVYDNCNTPILNTSPKYPAQLHFEIPAAFIDLQNRLISVEADYRALPLISQLKSAGLYVWAMWIGWFFIGRTRERRLAWLLVPLLMTLLTCLMSAGANIGTRYAFPILFTLPYLACIFARAILRDAAEADADRPAPADVIPAGYVMRNL